MILHPERTAISRRRPSFPTRKVEPLLAGRILDYGAGRGADTRYLKAKGFDIKPYDPFYFPSKPTRSEKFNWVLLNYVLNILPSLEERDAVLRHVFSCLQPGGHVLIAVRTKEEVDSSLRETAKPHGDGWVTRNQTFEHGFTREELVAEISKQGFQVQKFLSRGIAVAVKRFHPRRSRLLSSATQERKFARAKAGQPPVRFGKKTRQATYMHESLVQRLPEILRERVKQAEELLPLNARWNILKIAGNGKAISFLFYPDFDSDPHPALRFAYRVELSTKQISARSYEKSKNPFILHRKETLVDPEHPSFKQWKALSKAEEEAGLLGRPDIGTLNGWRKTLAASKTA